MNFCSLKNAGNQYFRRVYRSALFQAAGIYSTTNAINSAIPFLMLPILTRYLSPQDYGIVAMYGVLLGIVSAFTGLSIQGAIGRQYFERDQIKFPKYITNCLYILIVSSIVTGIFLWCCSDVISKATDFPSSWLWAVVVVAVCQFMTLIVLTLWQVQVKPIVYGSFQILLTITNIGITILLVVWLNMNWQGRVLAQVFTFIIFAVIAGLLLLRGNWLSRGFESGYVKKALSFGVPLIPHTLGALVICMTGRILITNMVGISDTGIYTVGTEIGMAIGMLQNSFNQAWVPWLFERLKIGDVEVKQRIVKITYLYNLLILIAALILSYVAPFLLKHLVGKEFIGASKYVLWIALGYAFNGMYKMVAGYIFYVQKTYILAWITFFTALLNLVLSYILIRINGPLGAAQGTMVAFLISFILTWILSAKVYEMPWNIFKREEKSGYRTVHEFAQ